MSDLRRLLFANQTRAYEGYPLVISRSVALRYLKQYQIYGNSEQDGTPTPANPVDVISVGDKTVNLFDKTITDNLMNGYISNATVGSTTKFVSYDGGDKCIRIPVKPNTTYTAIRKTDISSKYDRIRIVSATSPTAISNLTVITNISNDPSTPSATFTTLADTNNIIINVRNTGTVGTDWQQYLDNFMLVEGSVAPSSYVPYGYQIPVNVSGKNLVDFNTLEQGSFNYISGAETDSNNMVRTTWIPVKAGQQYTFSCDTTTPIGEGAYVYKKADNTIIAGSNNLVGTGFTLTIPSEVAYIRLRIGNNSYPHTVTTNYKMQLEQGSTATPYEPYHAPTTTQIYLSNQLRKVGTYADYIDYENQQVVRNVGVKVLDGTKNFSSDNSYIYFSVLDRVRGQTTVLSTHFKNDDIVKFTTVNLGWRKAKLLSFGLPDTTDGLKAWLAEQYAAGTPVTIYYPLATPVTESIVAPALPTMAGSTTYTTDTEVKPSNMKGVF